MLEDSHPVLEWLRRRKHSDHGFFTLDIVRDFPRNPFGSEKDTEASLRTLLDEGYLHFFNRQWHVSEYGLFQLSGKMPSGLKARLAMLSQHVKTYLNLFEKYQWTITHKSVLPLNPTSWDCALLNSLLKRQVCCIDTTGPN